MAALREPQHNVAMLRGNCRLEFSKLSQQVGDYRSVTVPELCVRVCPGTVCVFSPALQLVSMFKYNYKLPALTSSSPSYH